ncbi:MAG: VWA domain-containing protein [Bacteroidota bacterium]
MIRFEHSFFLYSLLVIPLLILLFIAFSKAKKRAMNDFGDSNIIKQLIPEYSDIRPRLKFYCLIMVITLIIIGISNPQVGSKIETAKRKGVDLMVVLDISNSMLAQDIKPNRLERAKQAIQKLIDKLDNDRIGLVVFAGKAFIQLPITTDYSAAKLFLDNTNTKLIGTQGTNIGEALQLAEKSFQENDKKNKAIIVISDGEDHQEDAMTIASEIAAKGIKIFTIGMGTPQGSPIPEISRNMQLTFKSDENGSVIISKLNEITLQKLAATGNGVYVNANNTNDGLDIIFNDINKIEKVEFEAREFSEFESRFQYLLFAALLVLVFELFIAEKKGKLFSNVNLFGTKNTK